MNCFVILAAATAMLATPTFAQTTTEVGEEIFEKLEPEDDEHVTNDG